MDEEKKKVDESWKEKVAGEKDAPAADGARTEDQEGHDLVPDFTFFVTTLSIQASIALGIIPNPVNNEKQQNLGQAKLLIDTLGMIKEKTQGNLTTEEDSLIDNALYELRMHYVEIMKEQAP